MKEHAKKALKHDFKVAGKTVPTLALVALFLVGTGSAALLSSFGTVEGTAHVDQPIQLDNTNQLSADATYDGATVVGGEVVATDAYTVNNNLNETLDVGFQTEIKNGSSGDWHDQSNVDGVSTSHLVYSQNDNDLDGGYGVTVSKTEPLTQDSDYAVSIEGGSTESLADDYAAVWYSVSSISKDDTLHIEASKGSEHDPAGVVDEVFVVTSDGTVYGGNPSESPEGEVTLDDSAWGVSTDGTSAPSDYSNIVAIGLGYGDASQAEESTDSDGSVIDITIDDVEIESSNIDEQKDVTLPVRANQTLGGYQLGTVEGNTQSRYGLQAVTSFDIDVLPQDYTVENRLVPQ